MKMKEAYCEVFEILNAYWEQSRVDDLGSMLSDMSPQTFISDASVSADPAVYADWREAWANEAGIDKEATPEQINSVANTLLDYYIDEVGYDIGDSRRMLKQGLGLQTNQFLKAV